MPWFQSSGCTIQRAGTCNTKSAEANFCVPFLFFFDFSVLVMVQCRRPDGSLHRYSCCPLAKGGLLGDYPKKEEWRRKKIRKKKKKDKIDEGKRGQLLQQRPTMCQQVVAAALTLRQGREAAPSPSGRAIDWRCGGDVQTALCSPRFS